MLRSQLLNAICGKVFVECGASYFELVNDIADEWVIFSVLKHCLGVFDILLVHCLGSATTPSAFCGGFETGAGIFNDQFALEFVEGCCHVEKEPPLRGAGINILSQHFEGDAALSDVRGCFNYLRERPRQSREFPDGQRIAAPQIIEGSLELGAIAMGSRGFLDEDPLAAYIAQGIHLKRGVLIHGGDAGVTDEHVFVHKSCFHHHKRTSDSEQGKRPDIL